MRVAAMVCRNTMKAQPAWIVVGVALCGVVAVSCLDLTVAPSGAGGAGGAGSAGSGGAGGAEDCQIGGGDYTCVAGIPEAWTLAWVVAGAFGDSSLPTSC